MARRKPTTLAARRAKVAEYIRKRWTYDQIAEKLGIGMGTVCRDVAALREQWAAQSMQDIEAHTIQLLRDIDDVEREAIRCFETKPVGERDVRWLNVRLRCAERRARLLGLDDRLAEIQAKAQADAAVAAVAAVQDTIAELTAQELADQYRQTVTH